MTRNHPRWIETSATITTCRYKFARLNTLTLGFPTTRRFHLTFDYYAHGQLYSGEFQADHAIAQNESIPIRYNPFRPEQNSLAGERMDVVASRGSLVIFGVAGSLVLSLLWLAVLRGCASQ